MLLLAAASGLRAWGIDAALEGRAPPLATEPRRGCRRGEADAARCLCARGGETRLCAARVAGEEDGGARGCLVAALSRPDVPDDPQIDRAGWLGVASRPDDLGALLAGLSLPRACDGPACDADDARRRISDAVEEGALWLCCDCCDADEGARCCCCCCCAAPPEREAADPATDPPRANGSPRSGVCPPADDLLSPGEEAAMSPGGGRAEEEDAEGRRSGRREEDGRADEEGPRSERRGEEEGGRCASGLVEDERAECTDLAEDGRCASGLEEGLRSREALADGARPKGEEGAREVGALFGGVAGALA